MWHPGNSDSLKFGLAYHRDFLPNSGAIFVETIRDAAPAAEYLSEPIPTVDFVLTHEIAHQSGADDGEGGIMGNENGSHNFGSDYFTAKTIKRFREDKTW